jgi:ribosome-binding protein aMBF1 (putative translation factor)
MKAAKKQIAKSKNNNINLKSYSIDQTFGKISKKKSFHRAYREEKERLRLARIIREARTAKNLTQSALAKKVKMPQSVIARLESGNHSISLNTLSKVAYVIGKQIELV